MSDSAAPGEPQAAEEEDEARAARSPASWAAALLRTASASVGSGALLAPSPPPAAACAAAAADGSALAEASTEALQDVRPFWSCHFPCGHTVHRSCPFFSPNRPVAHSGHEPEALALN
jgi:hypothetical protein